MYGIDMFVDMFVSGLKGHKVAGHTVAHAAHVVHVQELNFGRRAIVTGDAVRSGQQLILPAPAEQPALASNSAGSTSTSSSNPAQHLPPQPGEQHVPTQRPSDSNQAQQPPASQALTQLAPSIASLLPTDTAAASFLQPQAIATMVAMAGLSSLLSRKLHTSWGLKQQGSSQAQATAYTSAPGAAAGGVHPAVQAVLQGRHELQRSQARLLHVELVKSAAARPAAQPPLGTHSQASQPLPQQPSPSSPQQTPSAPPLKQGGAVGPVKADQAMLPAGEEQGLGAAAPANAWLPAAQRAALKGLPPQPPPKVHAARAAPGATIHRGQGPAAPLSQAAAAAAGPAASAPVQVIAAKGYASADSVAALGGPGAPPGPQQGTAQAGPPLTLSQPSTPASQPLSAPEPPDMSSSTPTGASSSRANSASTDASPSSSSSNLRGTPGVDQHAASLPPGSSSATAAAAGRHSPPPLPSSVQMGQHGLADQHQQLQQQQLQQQQQHSIGNGNVLGEQQQQQQQQQQAHTNGKGLGEQGQQATTTQPGSSSSPQTAEGVHFKTGEPLSEKEHLSADRSRVALKAALMDVVYCSARGVASSPDQRAGVEERVLALEALWKRPQPRSSSSSPLSALHGRWKLVYTSHPQTLLLLTALDSLPLVDVGDVYQVVDTSAMTAYNKVGEQAAMLQPSKAPRGEQHGGGEGLEANLVRRPAIDVTTPLSLISSLTAEARFEVQPPQALRVHLRRVGLDGQVQTPQVSRATLPPVHG
ncbi:hypothetical protein QJQ45_007640 [Haematococcus lacustris]|nr:hypothetical protein QJQ45_007640 [Haematococcus lacustris]